MGVFSSKQIFGLLGGHCEWSPAHLSCIEDSQTSQPNRGVLDKGVWLLGILGIANRSCDDPKALDGGSDQGREASEVNTLSLQTLFGRQNALCGKFESTVIEFQK
jgi:hypothetical protein